MLISHYEHLVDVEGMEWNYHTAMRGASEQAGSQSDDGTRHCSGPITVGHWQVVTPGKRSKAHSPSLYWEGC